MTKVPIKDSAAAMIMVHAFTVSVCSWKRLLAHSQ